MHRAGQLSRYAVLLRAKRADTSLAFSSSPHFATSQPNPRLHLDPSLQALLQDADMALHNRPKKQEQRFRELEVLSRAHLSEAESFPESRDQEESGEDLPRKSPAALFGSQRIGSVVLPLELQDTIERLISDANKRQIHSDAKRLFHRGGPEEDKWDVQYDKEYRTRVQAAKHARRDATAFASVALPAHYSAIFTILNHLKRRLASTWRVERVLDWGAGAGSGLWASLYSFQLPKHAQSIMQDLQVANTTIRSYVGIEKRNGLAEIGRRLLSDIQPEHMSVSWRKSWSKEHCVTAQNGGDTIALSAFLLTTLPGDEARKNLLQEMWDSGANTIILIDHNSKEGFQAIAGARQYLLDLGREGGGNSSLAGSHVVAPCPHDGACPLYFPGAVKLVCGFSQRMQRPEFVRRTKHSTVGHEDMEYSYVVIQRGPRPRLTMTNLGRVGAIGKRALEKETLDPLLRELQVHGEREHEAGRSALPSSTIPREDGALDKLEETLRLEAYQWPRLVFPPLKKGGHVILDGCTASGKIMRMTIPKSQGKQAFYDARKSHWGDIFPHPPKHKPQERQHVLKPGYFNAAGSDIGKRRRSNHIREGITYEGIAKALSKKRGDQRDRR